MPKFPATHDVARQLSITGDEWEEPTCSIEHEFRNWGNIHGAPTKLLNGDLKSLANWATENDAPSEMMDTVHLYADEHY